MAAVHAATRRDRRVRLGHFGVGRHLRDMTDLSVPELQAAGSIVDRAAVGDEAAFAQLIALHDGPMTRVAYVVTGDWDAAREAAQSAWTIAWRRLRTLRDPDRIQSWLVAIAANEARQLSRRERRRSVVEISVGAEPGADDPADRINLLDLRRALRDLKSDDRILIGMRYVAGFDSTEIALALGTSASGVRSRLARLLDRMREELDHD